MHFSSIHDATQKDIDDIINKITQSDMNYNEKKYLFGNDFTQESKKTKSLKTIFYFGAPIEHPEETYNSFVDRTEE